MALTALRRLKGFDHVLKVLSAMLRERQHRLVYLANSARVGPRRTDESQTKFTDDIGSAARHYKDGFDHSDDPLIRGVRDGVTGIVDGVGQAATSAVDAMGRKISEWRTKPSDQ